MWVDADFQICLWTLKVNGLLGRCRGKNHTRLCSFCVQSLTTGDRLFGWIYVLSWSLSFWPQPLMNWRRKATTGLAIDYPVINMLGFTCYTISTACFLFSPVIRQQYAARHPQSPEPTVRGNDLAFAVHAVILTALTYSQFYPSIWGFHVPSSQRISKPIAGILCGGCTAVCIVVLVVYFMAGSREQNPLDWAWLDVVSGTGV